MPQLRQRRSRRRSSPPAARRLSRRGRPCIGSNSSISCRSPTSCCAARSPTKRQKALGIKLQVETINGDGVQARISSAIQSKTGPDILMAVNNWSQLYADSVVDVSDVAEEIGKAQGGYYETAHAVANDGKKWIAVPYTILGVLFANRTSWFKDVGLRPRQISADLGRIPHRRQTAQSQGPALRPDSCPRLWRRAGVLVPVFVVVGRQGGRGRRQDRCAEQQGNDRVGQIRCAFWKECFDAGGLSWDDAGNNRAFLSNTISSTSNGASIYLLARSKPDTYLSEKGTPIYKDMFHAPAAQGSGRPVQLSRAVLEHRSGLYAEPEGGEGFSALVPIEGHLRAVVHLAAGFLGRQHQGVGATTRCGRSTR